MALSIGALEVSVADVPWVMKHPGGKWTLPQIVAQGPDYSSRDVKSMHCSHRHKVVFRIDEHQGEREEEGAIFASSPMFLNHLDASFISSHCFYVLCVISSPSPPMHPVFTCSL